MSCIIYTILNAHTYAICEDNRLKFSVSVHNSLVIQFYKYLCFYFYCHKVPYVRSRHICTLNIPIHKDTGKINKMLGTTLYLIFPSNISLNGKDGRSPEMCHVKTCFLPMRTIKVQISCASEQADQRLCCLLLDSITTHVSSFEI